MFRVMLSTANIFFSLLLGALAFGFVFLYYPSTMGNIFAAAGQFRTWLLNLGLAPKYNNWLVFLLEERQFVFMGFTIVMRILVAIVTNLVKVLFNRGFGSDAAASPSRSA